MVIRRLRCGARARTVHVRLALAGWTRNCPPAHAAVATSACDGPVPLLVGWVLVSFAFCLFVSTVRSLQLPPHLIVGEPEISGA